MIGTPNLEAAVETESSAISPAPTSGLIRNPTGPGLAATAGLASKKALARANSSKLSRLQWIRCSSAQCSSRSVLQGESKTIAEAGTPQ